MFEGVIGALRVNLGMNSASFNKGATEAQRRMAGLQRSFARVGRRMESVGRSMSVAFTAPFSAMAIAANSAASSLTDLTNQAAVAGVAVEPFKVMSLAARNYGVEQEKLSDILMSVNDRMGDFLQTGGGPMKDFFENIAPKVGLTAKAFAGLSSDQVLLKYVKALEDANVSQADMTFYLEALASDATLLAPILRDNGAAIGEMAAKAKALGLSLDADVIARAQAARADLALVGEVLKTNVQAALVDIVPILASFASAITPALKAVSDGFQALDPGLQKFIVIGSAVAAAVGPIVIVMGAFASAVGALLPVITAVGGALALLTGPIGLAVAAVAVLGGAVYALRDDSADAANATAGLTVALGDEITQSQLLSKALGVNGTMSEDAAKLKLQEAKSRYENVTAIIAEQQALRAAGADRFSDLGQKMADLVAWENEVRGAPSYGPIPDANRAGREADRELLLDLVDQRLVIREADKALADQAERTADNIKKLEYGLENASGGVVELGDALVEPIKPTEVLIETVDRQAGAAGGAAKSVKGLNEVLKDVPSLAGRIGEAFERMFDRLKAGDVSGAFSGMFDDIKKQGVAAFSDLVDTAFSKDGTDFSKIGKGLGDAFSDGMKSIGSAFSGGGLSSLFGGISSAVTSFLPVIGAISTVVNLIKGFSSKKLIGAGLEIGVSGGDLIGGHFETIKKSTFWGLVSSTRTRLSDFDTELASALGESLGGIQDTVRDAYEVAGLAVTDAMIDGVDLAIERIDTRGLSEGEIQERVEEVFAQYGDALSEAVGGVGFDLMVNFANVKPMLEAAGQLFYGTLEGMAGAAQALSDMFGGSDALGSAVGSFVDRFFTEQEKFDLLSDQLSDTFADLGLAIPSTREAFKELVLSQDLMTEAGREAYEALLSIGAVFDEVTGSVEDLGAAFSDGNAAFRSDFDARLAQVADLRGYSVSQSVVFDGGAQINGRLGDLLQATHEQTGLTREMLSVMERQEIFDGSSFEGDL